MIDTYLANSQANSFTNEAENKINDVAEMFASLEISQSLKVSSKVISSVNNTYTTDLPGINGIECCDNDNVYIYNYHRKKLIKAKLIDNSMTIVNCRDVQVRTVTMNSKNELLISPAPHSILVAVSQNDQEETVVFTCPSLEIVSCYFDKLSGLLFLGVKTKGPFFEISRSSLRQVLVLENYKQKKTLESAGDGKRLFTYPLRITTDSDGNIYVVDVINPHHHGRVVALDRDGKLKFTYSGHHNHNPFTPWGITVTPTNNVVIDDFRNHSLHVLRTDGQLLAKQETWELDIISPVSLCMNNEGFLVIGCNAYKGKSHAKIHVVKVLF